MGPAAEATTGGPFNRPLGGQWLTQIRAVEEAWRAYPGVNWDVEMQKTSESFVSWVASCLRALGSFSWPFFLSLFVSFSYRVVDVIIRLFPKPYFS